MQNKLLWKLQRKYLCEVDLKLKEELLKSNPLLINSKNGIGYSLLHLAVQAKNFDEVKLLLKYEVRVNVLDSKGNTPLLTDNILPEIAMILIEAGANLSATDKYCRTALHWASGYDNSSEIVEKILSETKDIINAEDKDGFTALHLAAHNDNIEIGKILVKAGANIRIKNKIGKTCLQMGSAEFKAAIIEAQQEMNELRPFGLPSPSNSGSVEMDDPIDLPAIKIQTMIGEFEDPSCCYSEFC